MRGLESLSTVAFKDLTPGSIAVFRMRDREYVALAARSPEETLKGHNLALLLAEADSEKPPSSAPTLYPYPDWGKQTCLDVSKGSHLSSNMKGRLLKTPWDLGSPYGALILIGQQIYLSAMAHRSEHDFVDIFVDMRTGDVHSELRPEPCYLLTEWSIGIDGPLGSWPWVQFEATKTMKLARP